MQIGITQNCVERLHHRIAFSPIGSGFHLPGNFLASVEEADYMISAESTIFSGNLTRDNSRMFLFEKFNVLNFLNQDLSLA